MEFKFVLVPEVLLKNFVYLGKIFVGSFKTSIFQISQPKILINIRGNLVYYHLSYIVLSIKIPVSYSLLKSIIKSN